jgi:hypothetical protein
MNQKSKPSSDWLFPGPKNLAVFTTADIMNRHKPILRVTNDSDDGLWQFYSGGLVSIKEAKILLLSEIVEIDPSVEQLADLPEG